MADRARWFRSFYWRIAVNFVVFVVAILVAQAALFRFILIRSDSPRNQFPDAVAFRVAGELSQRLAAGSSREEVSSWLKDAELRKTSPIYVLRKGSPEIVSNTTKPLDEGIRTSLEALLNEHYESNVFGTLGRPPVAIAPIQAHGVLEGLVIALPPQIGGDFGQLIVIGTVLLIVATAIAAAVVFGPARRRLKALEQAAAKIGSGDLTVRAPERGGDEIAHLAATFNRMAEELAARDATLRTVDQLRRQMLADVSHELKTPLTAMRGYVESLRISGETHDTETRERYLCTIERETLRLDRIVRDLVELARLEGSSIPFESRVFAVDRVFEHVIAHHEVDAKGRNVTFRIQVVGDGDQMIGDPDRIEQMVDNLVVNSLKHMPAGGVIELLSVDDNGSIRMTVVDSGEGIPPEHLPHIFERFYKADSSRSDPSGSGLGLSIVKAIVERHGGRISVESQPGRTAFNVIFPLDSGAATT